MNQTENPNLILLLPMSGKKQKSHSLESKEHTDIDSARKPSGRREMNILNKICLLLSSLLESIGTPSVRFCNKLHEMAEMIESKRQEGHTAREAAKAVRLRDRELEKEELAEAKRHAACT